MRMKGVDPEENSTAVNERQANNVKIVDVNPIVKKGRSSGSYLFPLSKGYNRLLFVLWILLAIIVGVVMKGATMFVGVSFLALVVEFILYLAAIWVYQGFKESSKVSDKNEK